MPISDREHEMLNNLVLGMRTPGIETSVIEMTRKSNGERVLVLCHRYTVNGRTDNIPFAEMLLGNPHELYNPPDTVRECTDAIPPPAPEIS